MVNERCDLKLEMKLEMGLEMKNKRILGVYWLVAEYHHPVLSVSSFFPLALEKLVVGIVDVYLCEHLYAWALKRKKRGEDVPILS